MNQKEFKHTHRRSILIRDCGHLFHKHLYELWKGKIMDSNTCGHRYIFGLRNMEK